jgi:hypothetical protein
VGVATQAAKGREGRRRGERERRPKARGARGGRGKRRGEEAGGEASRAAAAGSSRPAETRTWEEGGREPIIRLNLMIIEMYSCVCYHMITAVSGLTQTHRGRQILWFTLGLDSDAHDRVTLGFTRRETPAGGNVGRVECCGRGIAQRGREARKARDDVAGGEGRQMLEASRPEGVDGRGRGREERRTGGGGRGGGSREEVGWNREGRREV